MVDSYLEEFDRSYPMELPLTQEQVATIQQAINMRPKTKYVLKSQRVAEIEREQKMLCVLRRKVDRIDIPGFDRSSSISDFEETMFNSVVPQSYKFYRDGGTEMVRTKMEEHWERRKKQGKFVRGAQKDVSVSLRNLESEMTRLWQIEQKGTAGEDAVEQYLQRFLRCRFITNVILPSANYEKDAPKTAETDMLIFSPRGIYVCEVKNYGKAGQMLKIGNDGNVDKYDYAGRYLEDLGNPFSQNHLHCQAVDAALQRAGITNIPIYSVLVIANSDVRYENRSSYWTGDKYQLSNLVRKAEEAPLFSDEALEAAYQAVQAVRMGERKFPIPSIEEEYQTLNEAVDAIDSWNKAEKNWETNIVHKIEGWGKALTMSWNEHNPKWVRYGLYRYYRNWSLFRTVLLAVFMVLAAPGVLWKGFLFRKHLWRFIGASSLAVFLLFLIIYYYDKYKARCKHTIRHLMYRTIIVEPLVWALVTVFLFVLHALYFRVG